MPLYEYHCGSCGRDVELLQRSSDQQAVCPECRSTDLSRLLSVTARSTSAAADRELPVGCGRSQCCMGHCGSGGE